MKPKELLPLLNLGKNVERVLSMRNELPCRVSNDYLPNSSRGRNRFLKEIYDLGIGGYLLVKDRCLENLLEIYG